jgi:hypothetical protein
MKPTVCGGVAGFLLSFVEMSKWRKIGPIEDRWQLTVRLAAYTALALLLWEVGHRGIILTTNTVMHSALPVPAFTQAELKVKEQIEAQLSAVQPTHRLTLTDGRVIDCQIVARTENTLRVRECLGLSGQIVASYPRGKLRSLAPLPGDHFEVTLADVRLYEEFPTFKFAKFPPYTFVTDGSAGTIEQILQQLLRLRHQFVERFAPLIREPDRPRNIQVVFFSRQEAFKNYAKQVMPSFVNSAGFYSVEQNRLVILNQFGSGHYAHLREQIVRRQQGMDLSSDQDANAIAATTRRLASARVELDRMATAITERSINHEGTHQLLYAYGINSPGGAEPTWLKEGLAQYGEPEELGALHPELARRVGELRRKGELLPLPTLLNYHMDTGFLGLTKERTEAAYAQSWALVYFLMQEPTRGHFFNFIRRYRDANDPAAVAHLRDADVAEGLAAALGVDFPTFESRWLEFISNF